MLGRGWEHLQAVARALAGIAAPTSRLIVRLGHLPVGAVVVLVLVITVAVIAGGGVAYADDPPEQGDPPAQLEDLSGSEALAAGEDSFPTLIGADAWKPFALLPGQEVDRFLNPSAMVVEDRNGDQTLARSTFPIRAEDESGKQALVDLQLEARPEGWVPRNPLVPLEIGRTLSDGVGFADTPIRVHLAGAEQRTALTNEAGAFYPNVFADADYMVSPRPTGADLSWQLRSGDSPEQVRLNLDVPADASVEEVSGTPGAVQVIKDGALLGDLTPPQAVDAELKPVPVTTTVDATGVSYHVPHRGKGYTYPILLDPYLEWGGGRRTVYDDMKGFGTGFSAWVPGQIGGPFAFSTGNGWAGYGLHVETRNDSTAYAAGNFGQYQYAAHGVSFVYRAEYFNIYHDPWWTQAQFGLGNTSNQPEPNQRWWGTPNTSETTVGQSGARQVPGAATNWYTEVCAGTVSGGKGCDRSVGANGNRAEAKLSILAGATSRPPVGRLLVGGAVIYENDRVIPVLDSGGATPVVPTATRWYDHFTGSIAASFHDDGLGMKFVDIVASNADAVDSAQSPNGWAPLSSNPATSTCLGERASCPKQLGSNTVPMNYNIDKLRSGGPRTLRLKGEDIVGNLNVTGNPKAWQVKVDHDDPTGSSSGSLLPGGENRVEGDQAYNLRVNADDALSGAQKIKVVILDSGGGTVSTTTRDRGCTADPGCPTTTYTEDFPVDARTLNHGTYTLKVSVFDAVNREKALPDKTFIIDDSQGPTLQVSGGLRRPLGTGRDLALTATDSNSGVQSISLWVEDPSGPDDPAEADAKLHKVETCGSRCPTAPATENYQLPGTTPEGQYKLVARAKDKQGNKTFERWNVYVVNVPTDNRSRLGLEDWWTYDQTPAGGDSTVYVNGETGNAIWHSTPISDLGQGLSTVVNLTYNSQDTGGIFGASLGRSPIVNVGGASLANDALAGLSYGEAGVGFSIGISGPTRVNEPLHGVLEAALAEETAPATAEGLRITMNDADGTEHQFTRTGGKWVAPPGLNVWLRRYQDGGSAASPLSDKWAMTRPDGVTYFFDNLGYLTKTQDRNGNALIYTYERVDAFSGAACQAADVIGQLVGGTPRLCTKRLIKVTDAGQQDLTLEYQSGALADAPLAGMTPALPTNYPGLVGGKAGRISRITDHAGRTYTFDYTDGYLTRFTEAANKDEKRVTKLQYETAPSVLNAVGHDRYLTSVAELRDGTDAGSDISDDEEYAKTALCYPPRDGSATPAGYCDTSHDGVAIAVGAVRKARGPLQVTKRNGATKRYCYHVSTCVTPTSFDVTEQLHRAAGQTAEKTATTSFELDGRGRTTSQKDPLGTNTATAWNDTVNKASRVTRASGDTTDESAVEYTYDTTNGTGVVESTTTYPSWPATTDARVTDFVWSYGPGLHKSSAPAVVSQDTAGKFVADLDKLENPKANTGWDFTFNTAGNVTHRTDAKGNDTETVYDSAGRITDEYDELDHRTQYSDFHPTGLPRKVIDPRLKRWDYTYDPLGNVKSEVDPRGADRTGTGGQPYTSTLTYDAFDRLTNQKLPKLSTSGDFITRSWTYDRNGNQLTATDGEGKVTTSSYTKDDLPERITAPRGSEGETTAYVYDDADRLIAGVAPKGSDAVDLDAIRAAQLGTCTGSSQPTAVAYLTRYCLDDVGRVRAEVRTSTRADDASALIRSFSYDRRDNRVGMIDAKRNVGRTVAGAISATGTAGNLRASYAYNKADEQTAQTDWPTETGTGPGGVTRGPISWVYGYDKNGNRESIRDPRGAAATTTVQYDQRDQPIAQTDPLNRMTCIERQADERVIAVTTPRGTAGNQAACTDGNPATTYSSFSTRYSYDEAGNLLSRSVPTAPGQYGRTAAELANWKVTYVRNDVGDPTTITDARGNAITNTFYDSGDLHTTTRPSAWTVEEDAGVVRERTDSGAPSEGGGDPETDADAKGDFGSVDPEPLPDALPKAGSTTFAYDNEMRLTKVTDVADNSHIFGRDDQGRLTSHTMPYGQAPFAAAGDPLRAPIVISRTYDRDGNVDSTTDGESRQTTYGYDGYDASSPRWLPARRRRPRRPPTPTTPTTTSRSAKRLAGRSGSTALTRSIGRSA